MIWDGSICCDPVRNGSLRDSLFRVLLEWCDPRPLSHVNESDGSCTSFEGRATVEAIEESEASLERGKDECERHAKTEKEFEKACESASGGKAFRAKVVGQETRELAKYIRSRFKNKEIWDTTGPSGNHWSRRTETGRQTRNML